MPLPFDATLKDIVQKFTRAYEEQLGLLGPEPAAVLNVDLSTVSAAVSFAGKCADGRRAGRRDPPDG
jgi:hypothetical protein